MSHKTILGAWVEDPPRLALTGPLASAKTITTAPAQSCCFLPSSQLGPCKVPPPNCPEERSGQENPRGVCVCLSASMYVVVGEGLRGTWLVLAPCEVCVGVDVTINDYHSLTWFPSSCLHPGLKGPFLD